MLTVISFVYWRRTERVANLVGASATAAALALIQLRQVITPANEMQLTTGWTWVFWGLVFLLIAVVISILKGGANLSIRRHLARFNDRLRNTWPMQ
jgi:hypothetical protein